MHEVALARSLVEMIDEYAIDHGSDRVKKIHVRLGEMSAMTRALHFCFSSVASGSRCEGAELVIDEVALSVFCHNCDQVKFPTGRYSFRCPDCGMPTPKVVTGKEMQLVSIELFTDEELAEKSIRDNATIVGSQSTRLEVGAIYDDSVR